MNDNIEFYCPLNISKAKDAEGNEVMRLAGIASTFDEDADGEFLDPSGFVLEDFSNFGLVNWHHGSSDSPRTIIGEPHKAEITKKGLYVEVDLYPSSKMAREVYELAEVMKADSKKRKLGFSIEGTVIERDLTNQKIVKKALITGLAITHMPKNAQTFAEIIKACVTGKLGNVQKSLGTVEAEAVIPESVDNGKKKKKHKDATSIEKSKYSIKKMEYEERYDLIFDTFPDITIEKAEKFYDFINKTENAMSENKHIITDQKLQKAMAIFGIEGNSDNPFLEKSKESEETPEEIAAAVSKKMFKTDEEVNEDKKRTESKIHNEDEDEEDDENELEKSNMKNNNNAILKAIDASRDEQLENTRALGVLVKATLDRNDTLVKANQSLIEDNKTLKKAIEGMSLKLNSFGQTPSPRRSLRKAMPMQRQGFTEDGKAEGVTLSKSRNYKQVLDLLDNAAFAKGGYDEQFGKAVQNFESTKALPMDVISRIKNDFQITIVD